METHRVIAVTARAPQHVLTILDHAKHNIQTNPDIVLMELVQIMTPANARQQTAVSRDFAADLVQQTVHLPAVLAQAMPETQQNPATAIIQYVLTVLLYAKQMIRASQDIAPAHAMGTLALMIYLNTPD